MTKREQVIIRQTVIAMDLKSGLKPVEERKEIKILCFDLTNASQKAQLLWCTVGVFAFYLLYGYLQVRIFALE